CARTIYDGSYYFDYW
nr:immunoglobulin heavy chain junction region [Mus musculus]